MKRLASFASLLFLLFSACPNPEPTKLDPPDLASPADGSTISQNPPTLVWRAVEETGILYQFEVATDSAFGSVVYKSPSIFPPETSYVMDSVLASGTYYWHACVWEDC